MFIAKDFIETTEGLKFAVVANGVEQNKVLCFLRYVREADGGWKKYPTDAANALLRAQYPDYLYYSAQLNSLKLKWIQLVSKSKIYNQRN